MRVLNLVIILVVIALIGACVVAYFDFMHVPVLSDLAWKLKGYGAADTPDEALDRFKKAMENRNYVAAARFLDGDYQLQFRKQAKISEQLAKRIENFRSVAKDFGISSDKIEELLALLEPFPKKLTAEDVKKTDDKATAILKLEGSSRIGWPTRMPVNLKKTDGRWVLDLPLDAKARAHFDWLDRHAKNVDTALKVVINRMKTDAVTKENVLADLRQELKDALKGD
jgi:hypothetical protein